MAHVVWVMVCALITLLCAGDAFCREIGVTEAVEGLVRIKTGDLEFRQLQPKMPFALSDTIQTDKDAKVWLRIQDDAHISMGERAEIYPYDFDPSGPAQYFGAEQTSGLVRFIKKLPLTTPDSAHTITTPTALIQVEPTDRAADFFVQVYSPKHTVVSVAWGRVRVKNISDNIATERILESCQRCEVLEGLEPSPVVSVAPETLRELMQRTTIPNTLPEEVPDCRREASFGPPPEFGVDVYYPPMPHLVPIPWCRECEVWDGRSCVPCRYVGMECFHGRCVRKDCPKCTVWNGHKCVPCREIGRECVDGRCVPPKCRECTSWNGTRCVPCREMGLECVNRECVRKPCRECTMQRGNRCVPCRELGLECVSGRCASKDCPDCTVWDGQKCVSCESMGRVCSQGRCVRRHDCPQCTMRLGDQCAPCARAGRVCVDGRCVFRPCGPCEMRRGGDCVSCAAAGLTCEQGRCVRRHEAPPDLPPRIDIDPVKPGPERPDRPHRPDRPRPDIPDKPHKPDTPDRPDRPRPDIPGKPDIPDKPHRPDTPDKPDKPGKPADDDHTRPRPGMGPGSKPSIPDKPIFSPGGRQGGGETPHIERPSGKSESSTPGGRSPGGSRFDTTPQNPQRSPEMREPMRPGGPNEPKQDRMRPSFNM